MKFKGWGSLDSSCVMSCAVFELRQSQTRFLHEVPIILSSLLFSMLLVWHQVTDRYGSVVVLHR